MEKIVGSRQCDVPPLHASADCGVHDVHCRAKQSESRYARPRSQVSGFPYRKTAACSILQDQWT
ncbi:hypothetical protein M404DRAFT_1000610 [Pisolithus tinctorius Marx 270]|uniref:Uncharacterized protein n=1 Tax=Pisolithus tinctorius Marx 270 TaxID=870435 RepID=A0A0C3J605_PISTI|nr:hypothetical protein M404DRAFT_1000610 [Pisolithus tinctorius Marx 270]